MTKVLLCGRGMDTYFRGRYALLKCTSEAFHHFVKLGFKT